MDKILNSLNVDVLNKVLKAVPDFNKYSNEELEVITKIAIHCILNGPVGVNKETTFPDVDGGIKTIKEITHLTSTPWRNSCHRIATFLKSMPEFRDIVASAQTNNLFGDLWPLSTKRIDGGGDDDDGEVIPQRRNPQNQRGSRGRGGDSRGRGGDPRGRGGDLGGGLGGVI